MGHPYCGRTKHRIMINQALINPKSIVVVGGSNNWNKPGGKVVKNIIEGGFRGELMVTNPREREVQGMTCYSSVFDLPQVDLAILAISAKQCIEAVKVLADQKGTRAFIVIAAGFGEAGTEGQALENELVQIVNAHDACLIGPNCIGVINANYHGVFTSPIPKLDPHGCDLISGSGATAVFIMEAGMTLGLRFSSVFSVGNSAQVTVEDVLEHMDNTYEHGSSARIKLLYLETVKYPAKLLKHATSLIKKGAKIAAIKSGYTTAGSRAAASHTGALASSDLAVRALFRKAGIVYCSSREELITTASIFKHKALQGPNLAVITHAGGSAVMLTDALTSKGMQVPAIEGQVAEELLDNLNPGSSVSNPIDFLATGTADQLGIIIDYCEHKLDHIDGMAVVFGSPGLFDVQNVYNVLSTKMDVCQKPIFPVLPSVINAEKEIGKFLERGHVNFPDEVVLGNALPEVYATPPPNEEQLELAPISRALIREVIDSAVDGFLPAPLVTALLDAADIKRAQEAVVTDPEQAVEVANEMGFPLVMKVVGPVHKSELGGVITNIKSEKTVPIHFQNLMAIEGAEGVMIQSFLSGTELFVGVKHEPGFGHLVLAGLGGIFIEVIKDFSTRLAPLGYDEAKSMIRELKGYRLLKGYRGKEEVNETLFEEVIVKVAALVKAAPEIVEMDINPLIGNSGGVTSVDCRIRIEKGPEAP